jgi:twitching motility two-component system response regulator PilH
MPTHSTSHNARQERGTQALPGTERPAGAPALAAWQIEALQKLTREKPLLVTDDDVMSRKFYHALLADTFGLGLIETGDPAEALRICQRQPVSLVITCIIKPARIDGIKLVSDLRASANLRTLPLLVITASQHTRELAFEAGADAYLSKPCHPNEILQEIWLLLRSHVL